jgi:AbrB family looped-hinge helix DNA binding protein
MSHKLFLFWAFCRRSHLWLQQSRSDRIQLPFKIPYAILNGMRLRIDKAGRVILPKPLRDRLGLHEGSDLEMTETPEGVLLKPAEQQPSVVKKQGLWVYTGKLPPGFDSVKAIRDDREDRIRKLAGL